jgi:hypothetical protein
MYNNLWLIPRTIGTVNGERNEDVVSSIITRLWAMDVRKEPLQHCQVYRKSYIRTLVEKIQINCTRASYRRFSQTIDKRTHVSPNRRGSTELQSSCCCYRYVLRLVHFIPFVGHIRKGIICFVGAYPSAGEYAAA